MLQPSVERMIAPPSLPPKRVDEMKPMLQRIPYELESLWNCEAGIEQGRMDDRSALNVVIHRIDRGAASRPPCILPATSSPSSPVPVRWIEGAEPAFSGRRRMASPRPRAVGPGAGYRP